MGAPRTGLPQFEIVLRRATSGEQVQRFAFDLAPGEEIVFGRSGTNEIQIPDPDRKVSSRHGRIECRDDDSLWAWDLGSLNGTFLREQQLGAEAGTRIATGDALQVGDYELEVVLQSPDLDATISAADMRELADRLVDCLNAIYAGGPEGRPGAREATLRRLVGSALGNLRPREAAALVEDLTSGLVAQGPAPGAGTALPPPRNTAPLAAATERPALLGKTEANDAGAAGTTRPPGPPVSGPGLGALRALAARLVPGQSLETAADFEQFGDLLGQLIESSLDWLARALQGRGVFAQEFGAEVTLVFQRSNNPLKAMSREDLQKYLLDWRGAEGPQTRKYYFEGVLQDLTEHQVGVLAGVMEAVDRVIAQLAPERVLALAKQTRGWTKAGRAWRTYTNVFAELTAERKKLYNDVIVPSIQKGYLHQHGDDRKTGGAGSA